MSNGNTGSATRGRANVMTALNALGLLMLFMTALLAFLGVAGTGRGGFDATAIGLGIGSAVTASLLFAVARALRVLDAIADASRDSADAMARLVGKVREDS